TPSTTSVSGVPARDESRVTGPWGRSPMSFTMARPSPRPAVMLFVEENASKTWGRIESGMPGPSSFTTRVTWRPRGFSVIEIVPSRPPNDSQAFRTTCSIASRSWSALPATAGVGGGGREVELRGHHPRRGFGLERRNGRVDYRLEVHALDQRDTPAPFHGPPEAVERLRRHLSVQLEGLAEVTRQVGALREQRQVAKEGRERATEIVGEARQVEAEDAQRVFALWPSCLGRPCAHGVGRPSWPRGGRQPGLRWTVEPAHCARLRQSAT